MTGEKTHPKHQGGIIIQARMGSTRLPGKVLRQVKGKPVLGYLLERIAAAQIEPVVLVTSTLTMDDPIASFCGQVGIPCLRGDSANVASRFKLALDAYPFDYFVRICADSPLLDQNLVKQAVERFKNSQVDMVTNTHPRSFPKGQSVEVVGRAAFLKAYASFSQTEDYEHVTRFFYRFDSEFVIDNFSSHGDFGSLQLSIDTLQDFQVFETILANMDRPHWQYSYLELLDLAHTSNISLRKSA